MDKGRPLRRAEASIFLKEKFNLSYAPSTLAKYAVHPEMNGPPFIKSGRTPLYYEKDLYDWAIKLMGGLAPNSIITDVEDEGNKKPNIYFVVSADNNDIYPQMFESTELAEEKADELAFENPDMRFFVAKAITSVTYVSTLKKEVL